MKKTYAIILFLSFIINSFGQEEYIGYEDKNRIPCEMNKAIYKYKLTRDSSDLSIINYETVYIKNNQIIESCGFICIKECENLAMFHKMKEDRLILKHGKYQKWYENGNKENEVYYKEGLNDREKEYKYWTEDGEPIYNYADKYPEFPGGMSELRKYLGNHIVYPSIARERGIEEKIHVQFMVDKKGRIKNVHTIVGQNQILIDAAIKVISDMPKWIPGEKDGKKINVWYIVPITYRLN